jgi:hypothetical protein
MQSQLVDEWIDFLLPTDSISRISRLCHVSRDRVRAVREALFSENSVKIDLESNADDESQLHREKHPCFSVGISDSLE